MESDHSVKETDEAPQTEQDTSETCLKSEEMADTEIEKSDSGSQLDSAANKEEGKGNDSGDEPDVEEKVNDTEHKDPKENINQVHPYKKLLDEYKPPEACFHRVPKVKARPMNKVPCIEVQTKAMFQEVIEQFMQESEIGVAIKYSTASYVSQLCMVLISTKRANFLIDAIKLKGSLHMFNDIFANPKILKIMHGSPRILRVLQLDHKLYFVNMFDIQLALKNLNFTDTSYRHYIEAKYNVKPLNIPDTNKWMSRPLTENFKIHAIGDIHYLIPIYHDLKDRLLRKGTMEDILLECNKRCGQLYKKPSRNIADSFPQVLYMEPSKAYALHALDEFRHRIGKKRKMNVVAILNTKALKKIAVNLPSTKAQIQKYLDSHYADMYMNEIVKIIETAKKVIGPVLSRFSSNVKIIESKEPEAEVKKNRTGKTKKNKAFKNKSIPPGSTLIEQSKLIEKNLADMGVDRHLHNTINASIRQVLNEKMRAPFKFNRRLNDGPRNNRFNPNRRGSGPSPNRNFVRRPNPHMRPPVWEQNPGSVWMSNGPQAMNPWTSPNNNQPSSFMNNGGNNVGFNSFAVSPAPFNNFSNMGNFGARAQGLPNSGFQGKLDFQRPDSLGSNNRSDNMISYPKYNPSRYNKQGYY